MERTTRIGVLGAVLALVVLLCAGLGVRSTEAPERSAELPPPVLVPKSAKRLEPASLPREEVAVLTEIQRYAWTQYHSPPDYAPDAICRMAQTERFLNIRVGYDADGRFDPQCFDADDAHCICVADEWRARGIVDPDRADRYVDVSIELVEWDVAQELKLHARRILGYSPTKF